MSNTVTLPAAYAIPRLRAILKARRVWVKNERERLIMETIANAEEKYGLVCHKRRKIQIDRKQAIEILKKAASGFAVYSDWDRVEAVGSRKYDDCRKVFKSIENTPASIMSEVSVEVDPLTARMIHQGEKWNPSW